MLVLLHRPARLCQALAVPFLPRAAGQQLGQFLSCQIDEVRALAEEFEQWRLCAAFGADNALRTRRTALIVVTLLADEIKQALIEQACGRSEGELEEILLSA